jgi:osmotically-inducible protein OsmY
VRSALKANESTQEVNITVEAQQGRVVLKGIVVNEQEHQQAEQVAAGVKGVTGVENRLRLMKATRTFTYSKT